MTDVRRTSNETIPRARGGGRAGRWPLLALAAALAILPRPARAERWAVVTNGGSNSISVIDLDNLAAPVREIAVGIAPVGIAPRPGFPVVYVANSGSASVSRVNVATGLVATLNLPGSRPEALALTPNGKTLVVTSLERVPVGLASMSRVYLIDTASFTVIATVLVEDDPEDVEIAPNGNTAWLASDLKVQELELGPGLDFLTLRDVLVGVEGVDDYEGLAVAPDQTRLYVTNRLAARVEVVDLSTEIVIGTVATGLGPEAIVLRPGGAEAHVTNQNAASLTVFDLLTLGAPATFALPGIEPRGLIFLSDGSEGLAVMSMSGTVVRYDAATRTALGTPIAVGLLPEEITLVEFFPMNAARTWVIYR